MHEQLWSQLEHYFKWSGWLRQNKVFGKNSCSVDVVKLCTEMSLWHSTVCWSIFQTDHMKECGNADVFSTLWYTNIIFPKDLWKTHKVIRSERKNSSIKNETQNYLLNRDKMEPLRNLSKERHWIKCIARGRKIQISAPCSKDDKLYLIINSIQYQLQLTKTNKLTYFRASRSIFLTSSFILCFICWFITLQKL